MADFFTARVMDTKLRDIRFVQLPGVESMYQHFLRIIFLSGCSCVVAQAVDPVPEVELSGDGQAFQPVIIGKGASTETRALANDLAAYLSRMGGARFDVQVGDGGSGIVLGRVSDFETLPLHVSFDQGPFHRETYLLRSHDRGLWLIGNSDLAVSHAAWDLLYRLGHRQYFPGPTWEVIPPSRDLRLAVDTSETPDFYARRIWYNWGLMDYNAEPYRQWCQRNRVVQGFKLNSGHAYDSILAANRETFDAHPEYFALVDGQRRTQGGDIKFCISNPELRQLVVDDAVRRVKADPDLDSISMDPSDGGHWCTCQPCQKLGSVSDRVLLLANTVARAINRLDLGEKYVGMYAYNEHSPPPSIEADPHVIISVTTAFLRGGYSFDQILEGWQDRGATTGVYDYLSVVAWDWNLPRSGKGSRLDALQNDLPKFHRQGARFYDAESGDCWGPCGLGYYYASRVLWDVEQADHTDAIVEDFLSTAFGPAREPMRTFYQLLYQDSSRRPSADILGRMYRALEAAGKLTDDPKIVARLNDLILYTRYADLYYRFADGRIPLEAVARHAYRMRQTMMIHYYGLWSRLVGQQAALDPEHPWKSEQTFSTDEIAEYLAEGIGNYQPVDPGFQSVAFSKELVPAAEALRLPEVETGSFPAKPQDKQHYFVWLKTGAGKLDLKVRVEKVWANRSPKLSLFSPLDVKIEPVAVDESYQPDGRVSALRLVTPHSGLHRVETLDGGDHTYLQWPEGMPVTIESGIDTPGVKEHFRGAWSLYFYVPQGTKTVGGWASRIANWAPRISGKLLDGSGRVVHDFDQAEEGWFKIPVPEGEDGKLWKFENSQGQRLLMTVPPYLARSGTQLLLPAEVVENDRKP